ncbi:hypothetical protein [Bacillus sp. G16]|uniref:hypothetical protein n=1 Tax=Bacillus sp. G16 TaxID=667304 RepID=UPI001E49FCA6|nr:hypothetical protein [Bacillus sp. G16]MCE0739899.1 hypothetical protein [Bacillus sp. G16]
MVKIGGKTDTLGNGRRPGKSNWIHSSLAAGAFDIIPKRGKEFGINLHVSPERFYSDFRNIIVENCVRSADKGAVWLDYQ